MSGFLSQMFSPGAIFSGGLTFMNDKMMKPLGIKEGSTLFTVNDALKHGPLETTLEQGKPASFDALKTDRNERLSKDSSGNARKIADLAAIVGAAYGGGAMLGAGSGAASSASSGTAAAGSGFTNPASSTAAFNAANTGSSGSMGNMLPQMMKMMGGQGGGLGGMMGGLGGGRQSSAPQFDTSSWIQNQNDEQKRQLLAQFLKESGQQSQPEYDNYG